MRSILYQSVVNKKYERTGRRREREQMNGKLTCVGAAVPEPPIAELATPPVLAKGSPAASWPCPGPVLVSGDAGLTWLLGNQPTWLSMDAQYWCNTLYIQMK